MKPRGAGAAIVTEEAVLTGGFVPLSRYLKEQPAWSDLPVIVLTAAGEESSVRTNALLRVGHMMLVKRPVDVSALVTTVQSAVRDRRRQYQVRELIAEHERQAAMIRLSEEKFRTLADNVQQHFWTCLADGQCDYLSRQWVEYTGIPEAQQLGMKWLRLVIHPEDQERTLAAWREAIEDRRTYDLEFRIRRFDGEYHWFKTRGTPIRDDQDKIVKWFGTCTDIEDQKQAEEALRDADRKKDEFLAMLAHELRNPLAAIGNAAHILGSRDAQAHFPWVKDVISRQVKQLGRLIDDLLDVSRITRGKIELRKRKPGCFQRAQPGDRIGAPTYRAAEPPPHRRLRAGAAADRGRPDQVGADRGQSADQCRQVYASRRPDLAHGGARGLGRRHPGAR